MRWTRLLAANLFLSLSILMFISSAQAFEITSDDADVTIAPLELWTYNITTDTSWVGNITVTSTLGNDLVLQDWNLTYLPTEDAIGIYRINITFHDTVAEVETYDYLNLTLAVAPTASIESNILILGLAFGFGITALGMIDHRWMFFAGIVWVYLALAVFGLFGLPWMLIGTCIGLVLLTDGCFALAEGRN